MFSIVGAICGLPQAFRHQYVSTGAAESGEMRGRREGGKVGGELSPTGAMCLSSDCVSTVRAVGFPFMCDVPFYSGSSVPGLGSLGPF